MAPTARSPCGHWDGTSSMSLLADPEATAWTAPTILYIGGIA